MLLSAKGKAKRILFVCIRQRRLLHFGDVSLFSFALMLFVCLIERPLLRIARILLLSGVAVSSIKSSKKIENSKPLEAQSEHGHCITILWHSIYTKSAHFAS